MIVPMRWASALSDAKGTDVAVRDAADALTARLEGHAPHVLFTFVSPHHAASYGRLATLLAERFPTALQLGCSASGVIGAGHEREHAAALSLTAAVLPDVTLTPVHIEGPEVGAGPRSWHSLFPDAARSDAAFLVLDDPFSCDAEELVAQLDQAFPGAPKFGGVASGARTPGHNALFVDGTVHRTGAIVVAMTGAIAVDTAVAQGCRPVGDPMFVTRMEDNLILRLDRGAPLDVLQGIYETLDQRDRELFRHSLFLGMQMRDKQGGVYEAGDFLIRNIAGLDPDRNALAVAGRMAPYSVVQFHLRDARTSAEDLKAVLERHRRQVTAPPSGALLFSCLGRGEHLYGRADHDTDIFRDQVGDVPLGGFFCNGEIGPVGDRTFLHGYTSSFALFRPR
jgi:small ligand-binding sensory domain FIST